MTDDIKTVFIGPWEWIMRRVYHARHTDAAWHTDMNLKLVDLGLYWTAAVAGPYTYHIVGFAE